MPVLGAIAVEDFTPTQKTTFRGLIGVDGVLATETAARTAADNALQAAINSIVASGSSVPDYIYAGTYGVTADGVTDDTVALQACIDAAVAGNIAAIRLPLGNIKVTNTIHLGYGNNVFHFLQLLGFAEAGGYDSWGTNIISTFTDRPIINIAGGRSVRIKNLGVRGPSYTVTSSVPGGAPNLTDYAPVFNGYRYKPFVGIAVDAFACANPGQANQYTPPAAGGWDRYSSSDVQIFDCNIRNCEVGVCLRPSGGDANCDFLGIERCEIKNCMYGVSINSSQCRGNHISNSIITDSYAGVATGRFGPGLCSDVSVTNTCFDRNTWWFNGSDVEWAGTINFTECFAEDSIGIIKATAGNHFTVFNFNRNRINIGAIGSTTEVRSQIIVPNSTLNMSGCVIQNENVTSPTFVIRAGGVTNLVGNTWRRDSASAAPRFIVIPGSTQYRQHWIMGNSITGADYIPGAFAATRISSMSAAAYIGSANYTCDTAGIIINCSVNEYFTHTASGDEHVTVFLVVAKGGSNTAGTATIKQVSDCSNATTPLDTAATISRLATDRTGWQHSLSKAPLREMLGL